MTAQILSIWTLVCLVFLASYSTAKKPFTAEDCEVCVKVLDRFMEEAPKDLRDKSQADIEADLRKFCKGLKKHYKEDKFCYYIGASETSATSILGKYFIQPFKNYLPALKICEKFKTADPQICDLKYEKQIDLSEISFKKLKVKDLKKILSDWGEDKACKGCSEKSDFVRAVKELLPKYAPEAAKKLKERDEL